MLRQLSSSSARAVALRGAAAGSLVQPGLGRLRRPAVGAGPPPAWLGLAAAGRRGSSSSSSGGSGNVGQAVAAVSDAAAAEDAVLAAAAAAAGRRAGQQAPPVGVRGALGIYSELSKARLSALVVMTTSAGFLAAGGPVAWGPFAAVSIGTMLAAGSANTFNQILERENDRRMKRTFMRPLPSGRVTPQHAMGWGVASAAASAAILGIGANELTAALGMANLALYALPYTLSKTRSEINTWIGAVVGAVPPMMGWAAATNCSLEALLTTPEPLLLASALFLWQFPHFFALSWVHRRDYARGGFKMVPCHDPQGVRTADLILRYSAYMAPLPILAAAAGVTGSMFALEGSLLNAYLLRLALKFQRHRTDEHARAVFRCSLWYLPVLLGGFVFHSSNWAESKSKVDATVVNQEEAAENLVARARRQLAKVCMHEVMVHHKQQEAAGKDGANATSGSGSGIASSPPLCPPVIAGHAKGEVAGVLGKVSEEAAAATGARILLRTSGSSSSSAAAANGGAAAGADAAPR